MSHCPFSTNCTTKLTIICKFYTGVYNHHNRLVGSTTSRCKMVMKAHKQFQIEPFPNKDLDNMIVQDITLADRHLAFGVQQNYAHLSALARLVDNSWILLSHSFGSILVGESVSHEMAHWVHYQLWPHSIISIFELVQVLVNMSQCVSMQDAHTLLLVISIHVHVAVIC